jgi:hypothetical protein
MGIVMKFVARLTIAAFVLLAAAAVPLAVADNRVLVIGIDGAGGSFLNNANTPAIDTLIAGGGVRYNFLNEGALVPNPPSGYCASGVNWSTIVTGAAAMTRLATVPEPSTWILITLAAAKAYGTVRRRHHAGRM